MLFKLTMAVAAVCGCEVLQHIMTERDIEGAVFSRTEPKHKQMRLGQQDRQRTTKRLQYAVR